MACRETAASFRWYGPGAPGALLRLGRALAVDRSGATAIEYGLIAALVSVATIAVLGHLGIALSDIFLIASLDVQEAAAEALLRCQEVNSNCDGSKK